MQHKFLMLHAIDEEFFEYFYEEVFFFQINIFLLFVNLRYQSQTVDKRVNSQKRNQRNCTIMSPCERESKRSFKAENMQKKKTKINKNKERKT